MSWSWKGRSRPPPRLFATPPLFLSSSPGFTLGVQRRGKDMAATGAQSGRMLSRAAHPFTCPFLFHPNKYLSNAYSVPGVLHTLELPHILSRAFHDLPHCSSSHEPHLPFCFPPSVHPSISSFFLPPFLSPSFSSSLPPFFSLLCPQTSVWHLWLSFSLSVVSQSGVRPRGLQRTRLPCPLLTPGVCSNSCPLSQ